MSEGYKGGERGYLRTEQRSRKKGEEGGERGEKADAFLLRTCHISGTGRGSGGRRDRGGRDGVLVTTAKLSPPTRGHFSGTFLQFHAQKELAGGAISLFPM